MYSSPASMLAKARSGDERDHRPDGERRDQREERREPEQESVRVRRDQDLLEHQLDDVRERLRQARESTGD